jgi:hypothetical protein
MKHHYYLFNPQIRKLSDENSVINKKERRGKLTALTARGDSSILDASRTQAVATENASNRSRDFLEKQSS